MVAFCSLHRIGYNPELDPTCPQCMLGHIQPPDQLQVDINPSSEGYGRPMKAGEAVGSPDFPKVLGR